MRYITFIFIFIFSSQIFSLDKVVYDTDTRIEVEDVKQENQVLRNAAVSLISKFDIINTREGFSGFDVDTFGESYEMCSDQKFVDQKNPAFCSGCLVGSQEIVTAGHCITSDFDCSTTSIVFNFEGDEVRNSDIYKCKEILSSSNAGAGRDYAIIKLDRPVIDRAPAEWRSSDYPREGEKLLMIGSPAGLPLKATSGRAMTVDRSDAFGSVIKTNLDAFGGNSGSCVFSRSTKKIEGLLTQGAKDFQWDWSRRCNKVNVLNTDRIDFTKKESGETLQPITTIKNLLNRFATVSNRQDRVEEPEEIPVLDPPLEVPAEEPIAAEPTEEPIEEPIAEEPTEEPIEEPIAEEPVIDIDEQEDLWQEFLRDFFRRFL